MNYASRIVATAATDGYLPQRFKRVHSRFGSPTLGTIALTTAAAAIPVALQLIASAPPLESSTYLFTLFSLFWVVPYALLGIGAMVEMRRAGQFRPLSALAILVGACVFSVQRLEQVAAVLDVKARELLTPSTTTPGGLKQVPLSDLSDRVGRPVQRDTLSWREFDSVELDPILQAATRLFVVHGFHATTMREVAAAVGMSVAGVYHHYSAKERILVALLDFTMSEIAWRIQAARVEGQDALQSFALMVESRTQRPWSRAAPHFLQRAED